jgi:hypothetical protein
MKETTASRLEQLSRGIPRLLKAIKEEQFSEKPAPEKWSKKEILGHLIDSATNNHQRFIRVQFEDCPFIAYNADLWNANSYHQTMATEALIDFWAAYNLHLATVIRAIPEENLQRTCQTGENETHTLEFLITDYVAHLEHHLHQIVYFL